MLRKKATAVQHISDEVINLIMEMFDTMHKANGIGLAATQVGRMERVIVVDVSEIEDLKDVKPLTLINPEVVTSAGAWIVEEGCLSIPDVRDEVERPETITVRYRDTSFRLVELETGGLLGRVILHEIDHLNGVLFIDHLPGVKRKLHAEALKAIQRGEMEVNYPVVTAVDVAA
jgi:peptide deformylase